MIAARASLFAAIASASIAVASLSAAAQQAVCTDVLRVVGVRNDVLWLRSFPGIPETGGASNVLLGIPPDAVEVRDLGQTEGAWRRVSFRGVTGFASLRHLKQHMRYCTVRPQQPAPSASPGRLSSA